MIYRNERWCCIKTNAIWKMWTHDPKQMMTPHGKNMTPVFQKKPPPPLEKFIFLEKRSGLICFLFVLPWQDKAPPFTRSWVPVIKDMTTKTICLSRSSVTGARPPPVSHHSDAPPVTGRVAAGRRPPLSGVEMEAGGERVFRSWPLSALRRCGSKHSDRRSPSLVRLPLRQGARS